MYSILGISWFSSICLGLENTYVGSEMGIGRYLLI